MRTRTRHRERDISRHGPPKTAASSMESTECIAAQSTANRNNNISAWSEAAR